MGSEADEVEGSNGRNIGTFIVSADVRWAQFWTSYEAGAWEPSTLQAIESLFSPGKTFVDVGAWIGPTTLWALSHGFKVIAVEPDPVAQEALLENVSLNSFSNLFAIETRALYWRNSTSETLVSPVKTGDSMGSLVGRILGEGVRVKTVSGLDFFTRLSLEKGDIVKVDIEGGEYYLLPALWKFFRQSHLILFLSTHPTRMAPFYRNVERRQANRYLAVFFAFLPSLRLLPYFFSHKAFKSAKNHGELIPLPFFHSLRALFSGRNQEFFLIPR